MSRTVTLIVALALVSLMPDIANAQFPGRDRIVGRELYGAGGLGPTVSPYLNLLRRDSSLFENYFLLTRPQIRQRQFNVQQGFENQRLQRELGTLEQQALDGQFAAPAIRPTGSAAQFQTQRGYFMTRQNAAPGTR
jgi:hypothetical protein